MGIFDRLFGGHQSDDEPDDVLEEYPWDSSPSILEHIQAHIRPGEPGLAEDGETLPDEENLEGDFRWAAGAMDGVLTHHMGGGPDEDDVAGLLDLLRAYWTAPTAKNKAQVYEYIIEKGIVSVIDAFIDRLIALEDVNHDRLFELAWSFATEAPEREPVKFGIAMLGLYDQPQATEILRTLGRHDEFTLYSAIALANSVEDGEQELWNLAKNVDGWGRIQIVERLADTENAEIKDWMLREGYKNSVMYEYLACTCATAGGLLSALSSDTVDDEFLDSAGEIIHALLSGGPAESMDDYDDGTVVVGLYLNYVEDRAQSLSHFLTVAAINDFLGDDGEEIDWKARADTGWTPEK